MNWKSSGCKCKKNLKEWSKNKNKDKVAENPHGPVRLQGDSCLFSQIFARRMIFWHNYQISTLGKWFAPGRVHIARTGYR